MMLLRKLFTVGKLYKMKQKSMLNFVYYRILLKYSLIRSVSANNDQFAKQCETWMDDKGTIRVIMKNVKHRLQLIFLIMEWENLKKNSYLFLNGFSGEKRQNIKLEDLVLDYLWVKWLHKHLAEIQFCWIVHLQEQPFKYFTGGIIHFWVNSGVEKFILTFRCQLFNGNVIDNRKKSYF